MTDEAPSIENSEEGVTIRIAMQIRKRGGRREVVAPADVSGREIRKPRAQEPIVVALARAYAWQEMLESGRFDSISDLARVLDVDRTYVSRTLRLAQLAPDIIEAILRGDEPSGLSLNQLIAGFPLAWLEQRALLDRRSPAPKGREG